MYDDSSKVTLDPVYKQAAAVISTKYGYGDLIPSHVIDKALDIHFPSVGTPDAIKNVMLLKMTRVESLKTELLCNHKIALETVRGKGYRIIFPKEHTEFAKQKVITGVSKALKASARILDHTADHLLSMQELKENRETRGKLAAFACLTQKNLIEHMK